MFGENYKESQVFKSFPDQGWYYIENSAKNWHQIVFRITSEKFQKSRFATLLLSAKYINLLEKGWAVGFFRLDSNPGPFLLIRGDGYLEDIKKSSLNFALSFFKMEYGGIFGIHVYVDSEYLRKIRKTPHVFFEIIYGLDKIETVNLIKEFLNEDRLVIELADKDEKASINLINPFTRQFITCSVPHCKYEIVIALEKSCQQLLINEFHQLLQYHNYIPSYKRDFQASVQQLWGLIPENESPIQNS